MTDSQKLIPGIILTLLFSALSGCAFKLDHQDVISINIDFNEMLWFAERANAAYDTPEAIRKKFPKTVYVGKDKEKNIQYFIEVFDNKKLQVITIRGTDNLANMKQDADYIAAKDEKLGIYVHAGFDSDTQHIFNDVLPKLNRQYSVKVTGHSLGAAISALLMIYLHDEGFQIERSMNFGQPKFTNDEGAKKYGFLPLLRVINKNDLVPLLPPVTLLDSVHGRYEHFKPEVISLSHQYFVYLDEHDSERYLPSSFWLNIGNESIDDHSMVNYLAGIKTKLTQQRQVLYNDREKYIQ